MLLLMTVGFAAPAIGVRVGGDGHAFVRHRLGEQGAVDWSISMAPSRSWFDWAPLDQRTDRESWSGAASLRLRREPWAAEGWVAGPFGVASATFFRSDKVLYLAGDVESSSTTTFGAAAACGVWAGRRVTPHASVELDLAILGGSAQYASYAESPDWSVGVTPAGSFAVVFSW